MLFIYKDYLLETKVSKKAMQVDVWRENRYVGWNWGFESHEAAIDWAKTILDREEYWQLIPF